MNKVSGDGEHLFVRGGFGLSVSDHRMTSLTTPLSQMSERMRLPVVQLMGTVEDKEG